MKRPTALYLLAALIPIGLVTACSSVRILKVNGAPEPEGIPFYLPRPYVQVFEPFVIGSTAYLVSGKLSPDGQYLLIDNVTDSELLGGLFKSDLTSERSTQVPVSLIRQAQPTVAPARGAGPQGGDESAGESDRATPVAGGASAPAAAASSASAPKATESKPSGTYNLSVTNTESIFPPTLGRRFFDIVWMPDFDEKYVVQGTPGLGNANIGVTMTQGWGLYGLDARIDNSAVVKPLLDFYSTSFDALGKLARSKILPAGDLTGGGPQGALETATIPPGARVSIKVTKVQVVAPGLYPVLKPKEAANADDAARADKESVRRHLPLRPYTNIGFNIYEVVVVEATKPSGDTPMNLQRYFDSDGRTGAINVPPPPVQSGQGPFVVKDFETRINGLLANRKGPGGEVWKLSGLTVDGSKLTGTATLTGGTQKPTSLPTIEQLQSFVAAQSEARFVAGNVKLVEAK